jgi:hypothetical protein
MFSSAQRVMDQYAGARPSSKGGNSVEDDGYSELAASSASMWDSPDHVQTTINHLSSTLAGAPFVPLPICRHASRQLFVIV